MTIVDFERRRKKKEREKACKKLKKAKKDRDKAQEEFIALLQLANEYLKEAEKLQQKYNL